MRIGILTGGGDVPGLNPCIKAVVNRAIDEGHEIVGVRRGWGGLLWFNPDDPSTREEFIMPLDKQIVRKVDRTGGTFLHTSRTKPSKVRPSEVPDFLRDPEHPDAEEDDDRIRDFTPHVLRNLEILGIDRLIPIGGDDTLSYGERLHSEGFPVIAIPKTMDNDVYGAIIALVLVRPLHAAYSSSTNCAPQQAHMNALPSSNYSAVTLAKPA